MNNIMCIVRHECRRAERKWKKDKLQVSFQMLKESWHSYQRTVEAAKTKYFSDIIASNCHNPHVLFENVNSVLNAPQSPCLENSTEVCESFCMDELANIRAHISPHSYDPSISVTCFAVFDHFEPVTLPSLKEVIGHWKPIDLPVIKFRLAFLRKFRQSSVLTVCTSFIILSSYGSIVLWQLSSSPSSL